MLLFAAGGCALAGVNSVSSPDGRLVVTVEDGRPRLLLGEV